MGSEKPQFLPVGVGASSRQIAVRVRPGVGAPVFWLGGFRSDMLSTKAEALDQWAERLSRPFVRFDYMGHGESSGAFEQGTISLWLEDSLAVLRAFAQRPPILVGSSMGGWIALLAAKALQGSPQAPAGLVLIAPAVDFTQALMWEAFPEDIRRTIERDGLWLRPSAYSPEPYPITRRLIEDGRNHVILNQPVEPGCPVHILQGMLDPDVPWSHAMALVEHLPGEAVSLTLIKDGDHRLSRDEDIARLVAAVETMAG